MRPPLGHDVRTFEQSPGRPHGDNGRRLFSLCPVKSLRNKRLDSRLINIWRRDGVHCAPDASGEVVAREELRQILWPEDTFVDFEVGLNSAVWKPREALDES